MFKKKAKKTTSKKRHAKKEEEIKTIKTVPPKSINVVDVVKQAIVQVKYEEIGSWLATHKTPLFYAHKNGFTVVDQKFIDSHPKLKAELDKMVEEVTKKKIIPTAPKPKKESAEYIG